MTDWTRRSFLTASAATASLTTAACSGPQVKNGAQIDQEVAASRQLLFSTIPGTEQLAQRAAGVLIIPQIIEGGFFLGGSYGVGALQIGEATVDYISFSSATLGIQIGVQSFNQALFFMTQDVLRDFRVTDGWELGVDAEFAVLDNASGAIGASTNTVSQPVYAVIYGQRGLIAGVSLEGAKYSRLIR